MKRPAVLDQDVVVVPREHTFEAWNAMLSASPHATAWEEVKAYVECLGKECDDHIRMHGEKADQYIAERRRSNAAEARIAELEARLKEAERVITPFAREADQWDRYDGKEALVEQWNEGPASSLHVSDLRAARTWMEVK